MRPAERARRGPRQRVSGRLARPVTLEVRVARSSIPRVFAVLIGDALAVTDEISLEWRGPATDDEIIDLVESNGGSSTVGWWDQIRPYSLGWVTARTPDGMLVGFVNVAWDGGDHAFLLDTKTRPSHQHTGIGTELVRAAVTHARAAGCEWLHVDYQPELAAFYLDACGFESTEAGLINLRAV